MFCHTVLCPQSFSAALFMCYNSTESIPVKFLAGLQLSTDFGKFMKWVIPHWRIDMNFFQDAPACCVYLWSSSLLRGSGLQSNQLARPSGQCCASFPPVLLTGWAGRIRPWGWTSPPHGRSLLSALQPWPLSSSAGFGWNAEMIGKWKGFSHDECCGAAIHCFTYL